MDICLFKRWKQNIVSRYLLSNKAKEDLENIFTYISVDLTNLESASSLIHKLESKFQSLLDFPYAYPVIDNESLEMENLRKTRVESYLVIYYVNEEENNIIIVRVIHQRHDYL